MKIHRAVLALLLPAAVWIALPAGAAANQLSTGSIEFAPTVSFSHQNFKREGYGNVETTTRLDISLEQQVGTALSRHPHQVAHGGASGQQGRPARELPAQCAGDDPGQYPQMAELTKGCEQGEELVPLEYQRDGMVLLPQGLEVLAQLAAVDDRTGEPPTHLGARQLWIIIGVIREFPAHSQMAEMGNHFGAGINKGCHAIGRSRRTTIPCGIRQIIPRFRAAVRHAVFGHQRVIGHPHAAAGTGGRAAPSIGLFQDQH